MKIAHMQRRLKKLETKICPNTSGCTMEELCRLLWRQSKKEYISKAHKDCPTSGASSIYSSARMPSVVRPRLNRDGEAILHRRLGHLLQRLKTQAATDKAA
jgi:hypothetical protein